MTLMERLNQFSQQFFLDHAFLVIWLFIFVLFCADYYNRFLRVIKTDHEDLVERYIWLQLYRRYKNGKR